ncbi:hypothetical protein NLG97_g352 [Lecanicillium saksenae]|uniref:Uncharacterized protein n=1 Tax=Lecanicillium saksenae TaxID=468837 RepID=A0ACC1R9I6_9HYPO|nr:hypothetical protein NLG97_g352 [Lecanicillium saksenae]
MALPKFKVEAALDALQSPGFYYQNDPEVGKRALESFEDIDTEAGFRFYQDNFLGDQRISELLRRSFGQAQLVGYRTFPPDSTRIFQFRRGGEEADCIIVALLWPPNSEVIYYSDSLKHKMFAVDSDNGLLRVPQAAANQAGCGEGVTVSLKDGGLTIQDGRTLVTFLRGKPFAATFASEEFLKKWQWNKRVLSTTEDMERKLKASETEHLKLYVEFVRDSASPQPVQ